ncbi:MAG: NUDIX hydrolase [Bryobacterales bacterium]|nr:NUDIX hydrolase [Bryobacterales bacterium]
MTNPWKTLSSALKYENAWFRVRDDQVIRPDGNPGIYGVIEFAPSVGVVALNEREEVALVRQWRYTRNEATWELPVGSSKPEDGGLLIAAKRELAEEAGVEAAEWRQVGHIDSIVGATTERATFFLARGLRIREANPDPEEQIAVEWMPFRLALSMVLDGTITECISVAAILRVHLLLSEA